ncbi:Vps51/Vps67 [Nesidiocoris tenuis]|uniref:Vps51/Vps67 n=1 Tax=Nesidiocoris tenuis TaxID=355587 RepID=A0ABN7BBS6_9HEMI|nr:Vps51/Vps67 [Nesidiocoris tenuis]
MASDHLKKFGQADFNPEQYVKEVSQVCVGGPELLRHKTKIQLFAEETSQALKKNVYKNYMQFIETAREISHLEGEMYQLSHLLSEQRALLTSMASVPPPLEVAESSGIEEKRMDVLKTIMGNVENCPVLTEVAGRDLLHEGDLVELDVVENTALHRCRAYLFTDMVMVATWISDRRGPAKFKFESTYELGTLAVVNVRDLGSVKHAFKLLVFPDSRLFQCANHEAREEWLVKFDDAKKAKVPSEVTKKTKAPAPPRPDKKLPESPVRADSIDSGSNPFMWDEVYTSLENQHDGPDWLIECPDDLEVLIAQRHFEDAYNLIQRAQSHLKEIPNEEIKLNLDAKTQTLIEVLLGELAVDGDKSLQGGLRATRRSVRLLNQLNKSAQACELYLKVCSNVLKAQTKRVKREGTTLAYVKRISEVFFSSLAGITGEFQYRAFPHLPSCSSAFVVWASMELSHFMTHIVKQVFVPQTSLNTLAECVQIVRKASQQMCEMGLDLEYQLEGHLISPVTKALDETREKLIDAVRLRCAEDVWRPGKTPRSSIMSMTPSADDGAQHELTANTLSFIKLYSSLLDDCLTIAWPDLEHGIAKVLYDVFDAQLKHIAASRDNNKFLSQKPIILRNSRYLLVDFLGSCRSKYNMKMQHDCKAFERLQRTHALLLKDTSGRRPKDHLIGTNPYRRRRSRRSWARSSHRSSESNSVVTTYDRKYSFDRAHLPSRTPVIVPLRPATIRLSCRPSDRSPLDIGPAWPPWQVARTTTEREGSIVCHPDVL